MRLPGTLSPCNFPLIDYFAGRCKENESQALDIAASVTYIKSMRVLIPIQKVKEVYDDTYALGSMGGA